MIRIYQIQLTFGVFLMCRMRGHWRTIYDKFTKSENDYNNDNVLF